MIKMSALKAGLQFHLVEEGGWTVTFKDVCPEAVLVRIEEKDLVILVELYEDHAALLWDDPEDKREWTQKVKCVNSLPVIEAVMDIAFN